ncbi:hypothetical protein KHA80_12920 [Anaerobacillus sp. HL2]|nr:hypothetical protein KHA80_12920 [Anaerobacillus sp. HL2]
MTVEEPSNVLKPLDTKILYYTSCRMYVLTNIFEVIFLMEAMIERCAGLDVHQEQLLLVFYLTLNESPKKEIQTFSTTTRGLLSLNDWLSSFQVINSCNGKHWSLLETSMEPTRG